MEDKSAYRNIFKSLFLFGGAHLYQIMIGAIKSKFIAVLLGPVGIGIQGLLTSSTDLVKQFSSMGLAQSGVRDIAEANGMNDEASVSRKVNVVRRLVWWTGLLGAAAVLCLSPILSRVAFGNNDYCVSFMLLSVTLLFDQLSAGQLVVLQGMRRLKDLAKASSLGATMGLIVSVPLYYWLRVNGIVPTLILHSAATLLCFWLFARKIKVGQSDLTPKEVWQEGSTMLRMGIAMSVSSIVAAACVYVVRWFIRQADGTEAVGLFSAGSLILTTYAGMIFNAIGTDYYPRLAEAQADNGKCRELVNQQGEISACILGPILTICVFCMPVILKILYSDDFLPANDYIIWASAGMMFKLASWLISFQFIAKGESALFIKSEMIGAVYSLVFDLLGYYLAGLSGLGMSFTLGYLVYFLQVYFIARKRYSFSFSGSFIRIFIFFAILVTSALVAVLLSAGIVRWTVAAIMALSAIMFSLVAFEKKMGLHQMLKNR